MISTSFRLLARATIPTYYRHCVKINNNATLRTMKLETSQFYSLFTPELLKLSGLFKKYNYEIRIAGGAVRDLLMGQVPHDVDFATTATPAQMKEMFEIEEIRTINTKGEKHGTITARINDKENFEVTTLRIDVVTDGRHADVQFTKDWQLDSSRRDLTINSMFLDLDGTVYDYFNGTRDLLDARVRFVGDAETRIREDYLRILRYFRFFGRIVKNPNCHDQKTLDCIRQNVDGLANISGERMWMEVKKIVTGKFAPEIMAVMLECGVGEYIGLGEIPNTKSMFRACQNCAALDPQPVTILASLLTDDKDVGRVHKRLRLSNDELNTAKFIVQERNNFLNEEDKLRHCKSIAVELNGKDSKVFPKVVELLKYHGETDALREFERWEMPKFPVSGKALILKGVKGPAFTKILTDLRRDWIESRFELTAEELLRIADDHPALNR